MFAPAGSGAAPVADDTAHGADLALAEFVIDDDDYPAVIVSERSPTPISAPDRVDDIDDWLEEFAVADC
jgi:hypothetical protein